MSTTPANNHHARTNNWHSIRILAWLLLLAGSGAVAAPAIKTETAASVETFSTVIVNGVPIPEAELSREINRLAPVAEYHNLSRERWQAIRTQAIDNIVDRELFYREALQRGIGWDEQWVEYAFEKNRAKYAADRDVARILDDEQVKHRLYEDLRRAYVISKFWQQGKKRLMPTPQEVETYFLNRRNQYMSPKSAKVVELLVRMKPSATKPEWDKARKRIEAIYKAAKKEQGFSAYRKDRSGIRVTEKIIHEGMQGYDMKFVENLADGEIGKPVFTLQGYALIKKLKLIPSVAFSFEEVGDQVRNDLLNRKYQEWLDSLRQELREKSTIIIGAGPAYVGG